MNIAPPTKSIPEHLDRSIGGEDNNESGGGAKEDEEGGLKLDDWESEAS